MESSSETQLRTLAEGLMGRATAQAEAEVGASFDSRIGAALDLLAPGERVVALENLCSNIYEFDVRLSAAEYDAIASLGRTWAVAPERWEFLRAQVRS